jgi:hypothetical protein
MALMQINLPKENNSIYAIMQFFSNKKIYVGSVWITYFFIVSGVK